ncbi:DUF3221 domain-containing protein [Bacillus chungangensis]|uniref:Uncharacterized protein n=1 Tax=Bacillus chungangensis TaxID=587633 RepID=A0ABT9WPH9_9BACI|nr:DUF3221 domain-containing protein [Bacillus chungangensis]MDQ0175081.1 hypothetical protein [Bacillus chungangensis]
MAKISAFLIASLFFMSFPGDASSGNLINPALKSIEKTGFVTKITGNELLISDTRFSVEGAIFKTDQGKKLTMQDIKLGMKVKVVIEGPILESYPSKAKAASVTVLTDEKSQAESKAVYLVLKKHNDEALVVNNVITMDNNLFLVQYTNLSQIITLLNSEKPPAAAIVNSKTEEVKLMKTYTGFVTDINKQALVAESYFQLEKVLFTNDQGDTLTKEDIIPGIKVTVLYTGNVNPSLPAQAKASVFIVHTDEWSKKEANAVTILLNEVGSSTVVHPIVHKIKEKIAEIEYTDRNNFKQVKVIVDLEAKKVREFQEVEEKSNQRR